MTIAERLEEAQEWLAAAIENGDEDEIEEMAEDVRRLEVKLARQTMRAEM